MPPGTLPRSPLDAHRRDLEAAAVLVRSAHPILAARLLEAVEHEHPVEPHWYLALLATDPSAQGRGLGTALLQPVLERCDAEGVLAYTETQKESNVGWYARAGFAVSVEVRLPRTPTIWCLRREPRAARD
jgi:GNAT superfamily N-acetyltransferase